jgi:ABC-type sugar transport system substrate-binding protein
MTEYTEENTTSTRKRGKSWVARSTALGLAVVVVVGLSACAQSSTTGGGSSTGNSADAAAGVAKAAAELAAFSGPPTWQGPTETVSTAGLSGKRVVYINVSSGIPVLKYWSDTVTALAQANAGVKIEVVDAKGSVDEANKGFAMAMATKADAVVLQALAPSLFKKQIADAKAAGIKVITANSGAMGTALTGGQDAEVSFDYGKVGQLVGDWMVSDSKGKGKGLLITSDDVPASQTQAQGTISQVKALCAACDLQVKDVQIPAWETSIPTLFQSTINSQPDRTYLLPIYDGQSLPGLGAIRAAGAGSKVNVGTFNATEGIVEQLKDPTSGLKLDIGGDNTWWAYAATDTIFRVLSGTKPIENYKVGIRVFDTANKDLIKGTDAGAWFGYDGYKAEFLKLWTK